MRGAGRFLRDNALLFALTALVALLWSTPVVVPLKILTVLFHEIAHAAAAVLTGGEVVRLSVDLRQGGHAITAGGSRFVILSAGYLGSLLIGAAIFLTAHRGRSDRAVLAGLGLVLGGVALWAVRDAIGFALCAAAAVAMLAAARFLPVAAADLVLRLIGLTSLIYAPLDIFDDTLRRSGEMSDARLLATEIGGATVIWGALWLGVSLVVIALTLRAGLRRSGP